jgi:hypothetical protein
MKPDAEPDIARIFEESDAGSLPAEMGIIGRWLYSIDDVFLHLLERTDEAAGEDPRRNHDRPAFAKVMKDVSPYVSPYSPDTWRSHQDSVAKEFYSWRADI